MGCWCANSRIKRRSVDRKCVFEQISDRDESLHLVAIAGHPRVHQSQPWEVQNDFFRRG